MAFPHTQSNYRQLFQIPWSHASKKSATGWVQLSKRLTDQEIQSHLSGKELYGQVLKEDSVVSYVCLDFDYSEEERWDDFKAYVSSFFYLAAEPQTFG